MRGKQILTLEITEPRNEIHLLDDRTVSTPCINTVQVIKFYYYLSQLRLSSIHRETLNKVTETPCYK